MIVVEYRNNLQLIQDNKQLMQETVIRTLKKNAEEALQGYPTSIETVNKQWKELPLDFTLYYSGEHFYPFRFSGETTGKKSVLWESYDNFQAIDITTNEQTVMRLKALKEIDALLNHQSLNTNQKTKLNSIVKSYFDLVENYPLSPLEETISGLRFLNLGDNTRWGHMLVNTYLITGTSQFSPLFDYLFTQNQAFTREDLQYSIKNISILLERNNLRTEWFNQASNYLLKKSSSKIPNLLSNALHIERNTLIMSLSPSLMIKIPFKLEYELKRVLKQLQSQAILNNNDDIIIKKNNIINILPIDSLSFTIHRELWEKQQTSQKNYFIVKLTLSSFFVISLFAIIYNIYSQQRRHLKYINLRENFINLVSHELKTPLASIRLMVETLQKRYQRQLDLKNYPYKIVGEVDRLSLMVDNLLSMNRIKSGEVELSIEALNLQQLVTQVTQRFNEDSSINLHCHYELPKDYLVYADVMLLELVITNLFSNAIKYSQHEKTIITIKNKINSSAFFISDNACGISRKNWQLVFDDFFREKNKLAAKGSGVGLSVCKMILRLHNGNITIESSNTNPKEQTGTTWKIELPTVDINHREL